MSIRYWPDSLPGISKTGDSSPVAQTRRTDMEAGPARVRRVETAAHDMARLEWRMSPAEYEAFRHWYFGWAWSLAGSSDDVTGWTPSGAAVTADASAGPGQELADRIVEDDSTGAHRISRDLDAGLLPDGSAQIMVTMRAAGRTDARVLVNDTGDTTRSAVVDLAAGTLGATSGVTSAEVTARGNGWYRLTMVVPTGDGTGVTDPYLRINLMDGSDLTYTGDDESGIDVCEINVRMVTGMDLYIPTDAQGRGYGSAADAAWFLVSLPLGGGFKTVEARYVGGWTARMQGGLNRIVTAQLETRDA